jgi:hypothetical protein
VQLPTGYRQGIIPSITVILGFSLGFLRFWDFEAEGKWQWGSVLTLILTLHKNKAPQSSRKS